VAVQSSRSNSCVFGDVVESGIRAGPSKRLFCHLQNPLAVASRVGPRLSWGNLQTLGWHIKKLQPEAFSGYLI